MPLRPQPGFAQTLPPQYNDQRSEGPKKRATFGLFSSRNAGDLEKSGSNDLKRYLFERRSSTKTPSSSAPPTSFHSPRLSVVGRPSSKATSVLGIGIENRDDASRSWWRHNKLSRSSSRNSIASSINSNQSTVDHPTHDIKTDARSAPVTAPSTPRPRSRHGRSSRPPTRQAYEHPLPISPPRNFIHVTHTGPEHFTKISTATENDLVTEFSAVRAAQSPRRTLLGIKVGSIASRKSLLDPAPPSLTTGSTRSSYHAPPKSPGTPISIDGRHHRSLRSKSSFSLPFREGEDPGARRASSRASLSSRNGNVAGPMEDLPPLPPSNFTSARVSVSIDDYDDIEKEPQWCHAVTCDSEEKEVVQPSEGIALTTDDIVPSPSTSTFSTVPTLMPPGHQGARARSPTKSDRSSRSSRSLPPAPLPPQPRVNGADLPKSALKHELSSPKSDSSLRSRVKRSSVNGGLFSSWHADSDSEDDIIDPLDTIAEDPQDQEILDTENSYENQRFPEPVRAESPLPSTAPVELPAGFNEQPVSHEEVSTAPSDGNEVISKPEEGGILRRNVNSDKRATVVIGAFDRPHLDEKTTKNEQNEQTTRRSVPLRKNSGKTVRFKEDLCSFIREEVARRTAPDPEQSAGQVQASLEDLEATLARLEAEISGGLEKPETVQAPPANRIEDEPTADPVIDSETRSQQAERAPASRSQAKRPLSESYEKHPSRMSKGRARPPDPLPRSSPTMPRRRASYDDMIGLEQASDAATRAI